RRGLGQFASTSSSASTVVSTDFSVPAGACGLAVTSTTPAAGSTVTTVPFDYVVNFSNPVVPASVDASDFTVDGVTANSVALNPASTQAIFHYAAAPFSAQGQHTMSVAAGSILRASDSSPVAAFAGTFRYDAVLLSVDSTTPAAGGVISFPTTLDLNFNEPFDPASVQPTDLALSGVTGTSVTGLSFLNGNTTARFTISGSNEGTLGVSLSAGSITDAFGNSSAAFSASFVADITTIAYPIPL